MYGATKTPGSDGYPLQARESPNDDMPDTYVATPGEAKKYALSRMAILADTTDGQKHVVHWYDFCFKGDTLETPLHPTTLHQRILAIFRHCGGRNQRDEKAFIATASRIA